MGKSNKMGHKLFFRTLKAPLKRHSWTSTEPWTGLHASALGLYLLKQQRDPVPSQMAAPGWTPCSASSLLSIWSKRRTAPGHHTGPRTADAHCFPHIVSRSPLPHPTPASAAESWALALGSAAPGMRSLTPTSLPSLGSLLSLWSLLTDLSPSGFLTHSTWNGNTPPQHPDTLYILLVQFPPYTLYLSLPSSQQEYQQRFSPVLFTAMSLVPRRMSDMLQILSEYLWMEVRW